LIRSTLEGGMAILPPWRPPSTGRSTPVMKWPTGRQKQNRSHVVRRALLCYEGCRGQIDSRRGASLGSSLIFVNRRKSGSRESGHLRRIHDMNNHRRIEEVRVENQFDRGTPPVAEESSTTTWTCSVMSSQWANFITGVDLP